MNRELSQKMENIFMFSNMASQSLRRPVTNLLGANMLVTDMDASDEETDFWISVVKQSSEYLDYISHLLSYSIERENDTNRLTRTFNLGSLIQTIDSETGGVITKVHGKYESYESRHFHLFVKFIELIIYKLAVMKHATSSREIKLNESGNYFEVLCEGDDISVSESNEIEDDQLDLDRYVLTLANTLNIHIAFRNYGTSELSLKVSL